MKTRVTLFKTSKWIW